VAGFARKHLAAGVAGDVAAVFEDALKACSAALYARFHTGVGESGRFGRLLLGHALQFRQGQGFAVR
jgi:hypothetical protein